MDMDTSDIGRYGTLALLKRHEPDGVVAAYPIDDPEVTVGRDPACSIRLYYPSVSAVHCKVVFNEENKAFLIVLGTNGLLIDDCPVYPAAPNSPPTTVPLTNNTTLDIHKKRFRFTYPPKHLRPALAALPPTPTPSANETPGRRRRALRMSMIHSAHVFTPRPSADPRANLRVLQSPLKAPFARSGRDEDDSDEEDEYRDGEEESEEIVLVESDCPRVLESEKDLVILDHVTVSDLPVPPSPVIPQTPPRSPTKRTPARASHLIPMQSWAPPRTPVRRARPSLHRAVLIRSAQRAALRQEMQREEEMEAEEVEDSIMGDDGEEEGEEEGMEGIQEQSRELEEEKEEYEEQVVNTKEHDRKTPMSSWRRSLDAVKESLGWALRAASLERENLPEETAQDGHEEHEEAQNEDYDDNAEANGTMDHEGDHEMQDENEQPLYEEVYEEEHSMYQGQYDEEEEHDSQREGDAQPETAPLTPPHVPRPLGRFMTPQLTIADRHERLPNLRYSVGPGTQGIDTSMYGMSSASDVSGPRRVRLVEPWKIEDIVVPLNDTEDAEDKEHKHVEETKTAEEEENKAPEPSPKKREKVSVEERRAIRERRRSALRTPDTFFNGQVPGSRRTTLLPPSAPMLPALFANTGILSTRSNEPSGSSENPLGPPPAEEKEVAVSVKEEENAEDSQVLLARMRHMVEGVRRRQSVETGELSRRMSVSPRKRGGFSLLAKDREEEQDAEESRMVRVQEVEEEEQVEGWPEVEEDVIMEQEGAYEGEADVEGQEVEAGGEDEEAKVGVEVIQEDVEMVEEMEEHVEPGVEEEVDIDAEGETESEEGAVNGPPETVEESADAISRPLEVPQTPQLNDLRHLFSSRAAPSTPRFSGMREMFQEGASGVQKTPRMDGVREMFLRERPIGGMEESALEGVGELLATPAGWKKAAMEQPAEEPLEQQPQRQLDSKVTKASRLAASRIARGRGTAVASLPKRTPRSAIQPGAAPRRAPMSAPGESFPAEGSSSRTDADVTRVVRRMRTRTAESEQEASIPHSTRARTMRTEEKDQVSELPGKSTLAAGRSAGTSASGKNVTPATKVARRTRQTPEPGASETPATAATQSVRRTRRTPVPEEPPAPASTPRTTRRAAKLQEAAEEASTPDAARAEEASRAPTTTRVRRTVRSKIPVGTVKEEEDSLPIPLPRTRKATGVPRATAASGSTGKSASRTRSTTSAKKAGTAAATAATETSGSTMEESGAPVGDKENTPGPEEEPTPGRTVRTKATRRTARAHAGAEVALDMEEVTERTVVRAGKTRAAASRK